MTCFGHANAAINDGEGIVGLIRDESDVEFRLSIKLARIRKALNSNFVQGLKSTTPNPISLKIVPIYILNKTRGKSTEKL